MLWPIALLALGGFLAGGAWSIREQSKPLAVILALCAGLAVAGGVLRLV